MRLESLVLQGFKSFPDKTTVTFDSGLTAVVGPNGSGKSNISDAIRWVLGEQSSKTLRGEKMEDVVFAGTKRRKSQGFAQVTLHLENKDRRLSVDADHVSVSRKYYRQGDSEFSINDKPVRLKDVYELFMDTGLGRDGFSMIGQGRIEEIVSVKSTERRDLFETASGISKFRYHKEEAQRDLAKAEDNILRLNDILVELNARIKPLAGQAQKAKTFLDLAKQKEELDVFVAVSDLKELQGQIAKQEEAIAAIKKEYDDASRQVNLTQFHIEQAYEQMQKDAVALENSRLRRMQLDERLAEDLKADAVAENDILHNSREMERLNGEADKGHALLLAALRDLQTKETLLDGQEQKLSLLRQTITEKRQTLVSLSERAKSQSQSTQALLTELSKLQLSLTECSVKIHSGLEQLEREQQRREFLSAQLAERKKGWTLYEEEREQALAARNVMQEKLSEADNRIAGMQLRLKKRTEAAETVSQQIQSVKLRQKGDEQQLAMLRGMEQNMEGYSGAVKAVLAAVKARELSGVYGAVAQLISSKDEYTTAVETALGFTLQNIVVANEQTAKDAIRFLQQQNKGRATFMPLTSVNGRSVKPRNIEQESGFVGMANELVSFHPRYQNIVDFLLGKIVVMDEMENASVTARRYQYQFRIVTLDGQVINAGGTYTGGSKAVVSSSLSRKNKMDALQREIDDEKRALLALTEQREKALTELDQTKRDLEGLQEERSVISEDFMRAESECGRLSYTMAQERQFLSAQQAEFDELEISCKRRTDAVAVLQETKTELEDEIAQKKSDSAGADKETIALNKQEEALSEEIASLLLAEVSMQKDIDALKDELQKGKAAKESDDAALAQIKESVRRLEADNISLAGRREALQRQMEQAKLEKEQLSQKEAKLRERRNKAQSDVTVLQQREKELSVECERSRQRIERGREQVASRQTDYDGVIKRLYDEYELTRSEAFAKDFSALEYDYDGAKTRLADIKGRIRELGAVNLSAIEEYEEVSERKRILDEQLDDIERSKKTLNQLIADLTVEMEKRFREGFTAINRSFGRIFTELFGGGSARLELTDENDVLNCGIDIFVQPPGKIVKKLSLLSGGEKAFIAIILYFALLSVKPSPFCVLDEIEAALDDVNVTRYAQYLHRMSSQTQFILITHRRGTMEQADCMYGVTMQEAGVSKLLKLDHAAIAAEDKG